MVPRLCRVLVAATALLLHPTSGWSATAAVPKEPIGRGEFRGERRGSRPDGGHRPAPRAPIGPGGWWAPTAPPAPVPGPSVVIIQQAPGVVPAEPPPPASEPPYYWYSCGPAGTRPSPRPPASGYCIGGLSPSHAGRPGPGKTIEQFQADTAECQDWASARAATLPGVSGSMQARYDFAFHQCLKTAGNEVPEEGDSGKTGKQIPHPPGQ
jgi:hypothetical protein